MSCLTNPIEEDQCLFVTYKGNSPMDEMMSSRYVANRYLTTKHWNKIIVDIRNLQPMPTTMEVIGLASDLSSDLPRSARIALIITPEQAEYGKLAERVARIEGMNLQIFLDTANAKAWAKGTADETQMDAPGRTTTRSRH